MPNNDYHKTSANPIKALKDNYIWAFCQSHAQKAWVVDPGNAMPVIKALQEKKLLRYRPYR